MKRLMVAAAVLCTLPAGAAAAAPPWLPAQNLSKPATFVDAPEIVFTSGGLAFATRRESGPPDAGRPRFTTRIAVRERGTLLFGPPRTAPDFVTPLVPDGLDRVVALDTQERSRGRISLRARHGDARGAFGPPRTIATYVEGDGPPALAGPSGTLAAWIERTPRGRRIVRAAVKSRGRFRDPFTLRGRGRARDVVAGTALGVMVVAWERAGAVEARVKLSGRRSWSRVQRVGPTSKGATTFRVIGSGRRAYLAWLAENAESAVLRAAVLPVASTRFRETRTIDTIPRPPPAEEHPPALVSIPERDAFLAWTGWDGARWRARAAVTGPGASFGAAFDASPTGESAVLGDVASIPRGTRKPEGTVLAVWSRFDAVDAVGDRVRAAIRPPGGAFGAPEDVSYLDRARVPAVAFDFTSEAFTAVWSQRIGPESPAVPIEQVTTFALASTRPG